jgi:hypothetical protein
MRDAPDRSSWGFSGWVSRSASVGLLHGFPFWAFLLWWVRPYYTLTTPQQLQHLHNPYPLLQLSNSVFEINPY